jgi:PTH1 family peptidyl-tRNA hydrolase
MTPESDLQLIIPQLIVGLGNPEPKYDRTRHNIGFDAVDALVSAWQMSWKDNKRFQGLLAEGISPYGQKVRLLKPLTYMNRSGQAVRAVADWHKIPIESILIIYDDMDLPVGKMRMRLSGSAGGHNGMKSIIAHLNGQNFPRLRIGIGKSGDKLETIGHVLGKFSPSESEVMREVLNLSVQAIELSLKQGVEKSMSRYNGMSVSNK